MKYYAIHKKWETAYVIKSTHSFHVLPGSYFLIFIYSALYQVETKSSVKENSLIGFSNQPWENRYMSKFMATNSVIISLSLIFNQSKHSRVKMLSEIQPLYRHSLGLLLTTGVAFLTSISNTRLETVSQVSRQTGGEPFFSNPSS